MSQLEYLIALLSILVGLALADLIRSLRNLVRPGRPVQWHWLPLTWTAIIFLIILQLWWNSFGILQRDLFGEALAFFPYLLMFLLLYLASSFALPDLEWETKYLQVEGSSPEQNSPVLSEPLDLKSFYFSVSHRHWFFGTMTSLVGLSLILNVGITLWEGLPAIEVFWSTVINFVAMGVLAAPALTDRWWIHVAATFLVLGMLLFVLLTQGQLL